MAHDPRNLDDRILAEVPAGSVVLDVGAGLASYHNALVDKARVSMLDLHLPSLEDRRKRFGKRACYVYADALSYMSGFCGWPWPPFDVILGIDVIEHFDRPDALGLLDAMRGAARKVVLFVPEGNHPQGAHSGNPWQAHRSTWYAADIEALGFKVERWENFHSDPSKDPGALFCTWSASE